MIGRAASRAHGVVTRQELLGAGLSSTVISDRVQKGLLSRQYPGVYRVGHAAPSLAADYLAAVRACGPCAVLGGLAAAHLLRLRKVNPPPPPEVIAPKYRRVRGVRTSRAKLHPRETTIVHGIPVTTVPRTLTDVATRLSPDDLARACHEAGVLYRTTPRRVETVLARRRNAPGAANLRAVLRGDVRVTLSRIERILLDGLRAAGLPLPETNRVVDGRRVDARWPDRRVTVEVDGYRYHHSRHAWEKDRRREREARKRGDEVRRYTYGDVTERLHEVVAELRALLI